MAPAKVNVLFVLSSIILFTSSCVFSATVIKGHEIHWNNGSSRTNSSRIGVCRLEVPTIDLLTDEDKLLGHVPVGNGSNSRMSIIEVCCSGYQRKPHTFYNCEPICDDGCENGNCTKPNVCVCHRGYVKDYRQKCVATCPIGCENGVCTRNNECSCNAGYNLDPTKKFCIPHCSGGCGNGGECVGPETCECKKGYTKNESSHKCEFFCEGGCGGGTCIGPNQCSCKQGYIKKGDTCEPQCTRGCKNGVCVGPNKCACQPGWTLDSTNTICEAHCTQPCLNGQCTAPETCTCNHGYIKDTINNPVGNRCIAHCPEGCPNGQCSAPNFCICNPGYVKEVKGSNKCVRRQRRSVMHYELIPEQLYNSS